MSRHHMTGTGPVPFTPEEEVARDAEEAAEAAKRDIERHNKPLVAMIEAREAATGFSRKQREYFLENCGDAGLKSALRQVDDAISADRRNMRGKA